ncbi:MAG: tetratricopeptide repeat protein [Rickettsia endosymbiont of Eriopis connexa]|nr:tetratricopeptide repeat protein [Rickettsia endosymbiont of Eriopis connexa]
MILTKLGENKSALKANNNAINLDPKNSKYYWLKFMILEKLGEYKLASEAFDKYKALEQKFPQDIILTDKGEYKLKKEEALNALIEGDELNKLGKHKEALKTFEKAIALDNTKPMAYSFKAFALCYLGRYKKALIEINKALELDPNNLDTQTIKKLLQKKLHKK